MRVALVTLFLCSLAFGQRTTDYDGQGVSISRGPHYVDYTSRFYYDGSSNIEYICDTQSAQPTYTWSVAGSTLTNIVVATNVGTVTTPTAHGLAVNNQVIVRGSTTAALNGTYKIATVPSTTTFTITTSGVSDATYTTGISMSTTAPRTTAAIWKIQKFVYSGSSLTLRQNSDFKSICDNRASLSFR